MENKFKINFTNGTAERNGKEYKLYATHNGIGVRAEFGAVLFTSANSEVLNG